MSREPVRLETPRLVLDGHTAADFDAMATIWADPAVVRHIGSKPSSRQDSWMRLLRYGGLWPILGYGYWAVREKTTGRCMGDIGFADFHRSLVPSIEGVPEAGWVFASWAHGQGFAGEALAAAFGWLDAQPAFDRSVCIIDPDNERSLRLAARLGFGSPVTVPNGEEELLLLERRRRG